MIFFGELSALFTAFLWTNSSIIFTAASIRIGSIQLNIDRMLMAILYLVITIIILQINIFLNPQQIILLALSGITGLIIGDTSLFNSFSEIGPRYTMLLYSTNPGIAAIFSYLILGESLGLNTIIGIIITICGVALVAFEKKINTNQFQFNSKGLFWGLMSAVGQGVGLVIAKMAFQYGELHCFAATLIRISTAAIIMILISMSFGRYKNPVKFYLKDKKSLKLVALGAFIGPYLGITLSFVALEHTSVGIAATLMSTIPIMIIPISKYFYKEKISTISLIGSIIAVSGIAILFLF